jgi:poly(A) polymerase
VRDAGDLLPELLSLTRADCTTRNRRKAEALARRIDDLEVRIAELQEREELASIRPDLDGREVMDHLGVPPGRVVGDALSFLLEERLERGPLEREQALALLDGWWAARGSGADGSAGARSGEEHGGPDRDSDEER